MTFRWKIFLIILVTCLMIVCLTLFFRFASFKSEVKKEIDQRELEVKILNGCGIPGLARDYEDYLKKRFSGYDNSMFKFSEPSNTRKYIYNKSIIVVSQELEEIEKPNNLEVLIERTGIENWTYAIDNVELPDYQFLIIIGRDFQNIMK